MNIDNIKIKEESLKLAEETLADIELSRIPLANIALKASRLARLVNNFELEKIFEYEAGGYPKDNGIDKQVWLLGKKANRISINANNEEVMNYYAIATIEENIIANKIFLEHTQDRNISIIPANPDRYALLANVIERNTRLERITENTRRLTENTGLLAERTSFIYSNVKKIYIDLKFSSLTESTWLKMKSKIDSYISEIIPEETQKLIAIYDSLNDDNPEKWATALTSCRRMLKAIADKLYPPTDKIIEKGKQKIKLGEEQFINRLMRYVEEKATHKTLDKITNSNLDYIGKRLDNILNETCKGTHANVGKEEAERCFMHVYMIIGDILEIERQAQKNNEG